ncbi:leucine-rich repeat domain-containing protein [Chryseobacterium sp.]|uniref:leucine-rich repeat domain-containing protein n=1 Tax=Chryseobacterium sp. TaxID=1871047 RepID=UPI0025BA272A|nr:leucine-rich repeat domain-containing protein [Chryseobacterium sp.]
MRKKKIFATVSIFFSLAFLSGQKLSFKDKNFEKAVIENYDTDKNGFIDKNEAQTVSQLFLVKKGISSAEDLIFFPNVKIILLDENSIRNLSLKNMDQLELFSCTQCKISVFKGENLKNLTSLYLDQNILDNIHLKDIPKIDQLTLSLNRLRNIDLSALKNLRRLNLEHNQIQSLDISGNTNLQTLNLGGNKIKDSNIQKGFANVIIFGTE